MEEQRRKYEGEVDRNSRQSERLELAARSESYTLSSSMVEKDAELKRAEALAKEWQQIELRLREEARMAKQEAKSGVKFADRLRQGQWLAVTLRHDPTTRNP